MNSEKLQANPELTIDYLAQDNARFHTVRALYEY